MAQRPPAASEAGNPRMTTDGTTIGMVTGFFHPPEKAAESHGHRMGKHPISHGSTPQTPSRESGKRTKAALPRKEQPTGREPGANPAAPQGKAGERAQTQNA